MTRLMIVWMILHTFLCVFLGAYYQRAIVVRRNKPNNSVTVFSVTLVVGVTMSVGVCLGAIFWALVLK